MEEQQALLDSMTAQKQERTEMMQREREARDVAAAAQVRQARLTASARVFSTCWATRTRAARSGGGGGKTDKAGRRLNWSRCVVLQHVFGHGRRSCCVTASPWRLLRWLRGRRRQRCGFCPSA